MERIFSLWKQWQFLLAELFLLVFFVLFLGSSFFPLVQSGVGENVTVLTNLTVGKSAPLVTNISLNYGADITLTANSTTEVNCTALITDYDNESSVSNVTGEIFDSVASFPGDGDDNNTHYSNGSCALDLSYGDEYELLSTCTFQVYYYANPTFWNCSVLVTDEDNFNATDQNDTTSVNELLALEVPAVINYGTVNATQVSSEQIVNVTNRGNVMFNLSLSGYAFTEGDPNAMNCTLGSSQNISLEYEKYNLTSSIAGSLTLSEFEGNYTNLTSTTSPTIGLFNLDYRQDAAGNDYSNVTYWRTYVPLGVAGSCQGNVIFGAVSAGAS